MSDEETVTELLDKGELYCGATLVSAFENNLMNLQPGTCGGKRMKYSRSSMFGIFAVCQDCWKETYINRP